jgi:hypothetical protein
MKNIFRVLISQKKQSEAEKTHRKTCATQNSWTKRMFIRLKRPEDKNLFLKYEETGVFLMLDVIFLKPPSSHIGSI